MRGEVNSQKKAQEAETKFIKIIRNTTVEKFLY